MSQGQRLGRVSTRERGTWLGRADVVPPGAEEGRGFEEGHYFCFFCISLHTIWNIPLLADISMSCSSRDHFDMRAIINIVNVFPTHQKGAPDLQL